MPCVGFLNSLGLVGMGCIVAFLFIQLQYVSYKLNNDHNDLVILKQQVQNQTEGQIQELAVQVEQQQDYSIYQLAGTFTLLTCLLTMFHMGSHLRNLYEPFVQRKILAILWMSPIYSLTSFLSLLLPKTEGYLSIIKDFYESYVVYTFLSFLIAVLGRGDREVVVQLLSRHASHLPNPARCLGRFYDPPPETSDGAKANAVLMECQICAMQFVLVRPITSILSFLVFVLGDEGDQSTAKGYFISPNFAIAMIENVSVFFAFSGLLKFYHAVAEDLAWLQPFNKFLAIKGIVFLTFWQGLAISIIVHLDGHIDDENTSKSHYQAAAIQNLLICVEMLFFSLAHWCVFPVEEWEPDYLPKQMARPGLGLKDFAKDFRVIMGKGQHQQGVIPIPQEPIDMDMPSLGIGNDDDVDDYMGQDKIVEQRGPGAGAPFLGTTSEIL